MKKIITLVALATLISAPAFAKTSTPTEHHARYHAEYQNQANTGNASNFQNQWNDGNW
jgi:hypothetical protein